MAGAAPVINANEVTEFSKKTLTFGKAGGTADVDRNSI